MSTASDLSFGAQTEQTSLLFIAKKTAAVTAGFSALFEYKKPREQRFPASSHGPHRGGGKVRAYSGSSLFQK